MADRRCATCNTVRSGIKYEAALSDGTKQQFDIRREAETFVRNSGLSGKIYPVRTTT